MRNRVGSVPGKIIAGQSGVTLLAAALFGLAMDGEAALGALAGGGISILLSLWMALRVFSVPAEAGPQAMFSAFVKAEAMKMVMAVVLFSAAAIFLSHVFVPLVVTFAATLVVNWLALVFTRRDRQGFGG
ncbi:MAG TPA: ATP synthase subunit I [Gammaproteobacteria bacterium]|nr:ATP synthase subunit I [Gammaproteobacteria bacterium]